MAQAPLKTFADPIVKRHCSAAMTILRVRDSACKVLDPQTFEQAAGHLRAIQKATGLTPPQVCDALRIHAWRRRGVMPYSANGQRFRMTLRQYEDAHSLQGRIRRAHGADAIPQPGRRVKLYRPRDAQPLDPLAP